MSDVPTILTDIMKKDREKDAGSVRRKWVISITIFAFLLSVFMSLFSETVLRNSTLITAFIVLIVIVLMGVVFDIIGVAVTVAEDKPFHSMAAGKIKGARSSLRLIKNASRVSNVCNDVVGDTCGIISGTAAAFIVTQADEIGFMDKTAFALILSGMVASVTIGGKALGKEFAILHAKEIIRIMGRIIAIFTEHKIKKK